MRHKDSCTNICVEHVGKVLFGDRIKWGGLVDARIIDEDVNLRSECGYRGIDNLARGGSVSQISLDFDCSSFAARFQASDALNELINAIRRSRRRVCDDNLVQCQRTVRYLVKSIAPSPLAERAPSRLLLLCRASRRSRLRSFLPTSRRAAGRKP